MSLKFQKRPEVSFLASTSAIQKVFVKSIHHLKYFLDLIAATAIENFLYSFLYFSPSLVVYRYYKFIWNSSIYIYIYLQNKK